jgi:ribosome-associated toxin RatA of RatAB toxin-antitoxin module
MRVVHKTEIVPYSAAQMYRLVNDIESYPDYLPWCRETTVFSRSEHEVRASIQLARGAVHHSFSTLNQMQPNQRIEVQLLEGPFKHLKGLWLFEDLGDAGCRINFNLEFVLSNRILDMAVGPVLEKIANTFVEAFTERAAKIYGEAEKASSITTSITSSSNKIL